MTVAVKMMSKDVRPAINRRARKLRRIKSGFKIAFSPINRALLDSPAIYRGVGAQIILTSF